jgi:hypothetical protein
MNCFNHNNIIQLLKFFILDAVSVFLCPSRSRLVARLSNLKYCVDGSVCNCGNRTKGLIALSWFYFTNLHAVAASLEDRPVQPCFVASLPRSSHSRSTFSMLLPAAEHFGVVHTIHLTRVLCIPPLERRSDQLLVGRVGAVVPMGWRKCDGRWKSSLKTRCILHSSISVRTS